MTIERQDTETVDAIDAEVRRLDELRHGLFTDLSHELRTPLTAMKLGMQGLCAQLRGTLDAKQQELVDINRRNIDRIVTLVENQLELLQMVLGDTFVEPRQVEMNGFLSDIPKRMTRRPGNEWIESIEVHAETTESPIHVETDPDALHSIVGCLLSSGAPRARRSLNLNADEDGGVCTLTIRIDFLGAVPEAHAPEIGSTADSGSVPSLVSPANSLEFETRAISALMESLGGSVDLEHHADYKEARLHVPLYSME